MCELEEREVGGGLASKGGSIRLLLTGKGLEFQHKSSLYIGSNAFLFYMKQIPSLSAVVLDLLPAFLQCFSENFHIFVRLDPNQFLGQVDLKRHTSQLVEDFGNSSRASLTRHRHLKLVLGHC